MGRTPSGIKSIRLDDAIDKFCERARIRQAKETARQKTNVMKAFKEIIGGTTPVWMLKRENFETVYDAIVNGYTPEGDTLGRRSRLGRNTKGSRQQLRCILRTFATFCHDNEWLLESVTIPKTDLFPSVRQTMTPRREFFVIPRDEWDIVLGLAEELHARLRIAVALGFHSGRRVSEIIRLQWRDIDWRHGEVKFHIIKKGLPIGATSGITPLYPELREALEWWRRWITTHYGVPQPDWFVVPAKLHPSAIGHRGMGDVWSDPSQWPLNMKKQMYPTTLNEDVRKLFAYFGVGPDEGTGMHTFRRSAAVHIADKHGLETAQAFLGHDTVVTTQQYTRNREGYKKLRETLMGEEEVAVVRSIFEWGSNPGPHVVGDYGPLRLVG